MIPPKDYRRPVFLITCGRFSPGRRIARFSTIAG
jgi:hypothetical protein